MWAEGVRSGGGVFFFYILECSILNAYVLDGAASVSEHAQKGRAKRDILHFRLELARQLIGNFSSRSRLGRPRSDTHAQLLRLQNHHQHWPIHVNRKNNCVVCAGKVNRRKLPSRGNQHETRVMCKCCNVYLCFAIGRDCFEEYHTKVDYCR